jgi:spermidine synthase
MKPLKTIETVKTPDGQLALKSRGPTDFLITIDNRVLMTSVARRSEERLGTVACQKLVGVAQPRVLVGGLGMAFTLRAVLDAVPPAAKIVVAELNAVVEQWCRGPLAEMTERAVEDPRVQVVLGDVTKLVRAAANGGINSRYDAIVIDLYVGPDAGTEPHDRLYGIRACSDARAALRKGGTFAIWGERYDSAYAKRLESVGFSVKAERPGRGGLKHAVYVATAV